MPSITPSYIKEKWQHAGFQKYLKNTSWMFFGRVFTLITSFFVGVYIARYLGPSNYGLFNYVISFVGLFGFLSSFGMDNIISREIIKDHNRKDELIGTGFYLKIFGGLVAVMCVFIVSFFTTNDLFTLGLIWIFSLNFIPQAFNVIETYFQSQVLSKKVVIAQVLSNIISILLKIVCIMSGKGIFWLTIILITETFIYSGILLFLFRKFGNHIKNWKFDINIAKSILRDSWPLMLSAIAVGIYMKIDQVMIKNMLGNEQAGIYAVAAKLSEAWYFIPMIICTSIFPSIVMAMNNSKEIFENRMKKLYFIMFWLSVGIAMVITVFASLIVTVLFGSPYLGSVPVLQIYVWAGIGVSLGIVVSQYLLINNLTKISFYNTLFGAFLNVILNIVLIPKMGIGGAAIATLISYIVSVFGIFIFRKSRSHGFLLLRSIIGYR